VWGSCASLRIVVFRPSAGPKLVTCTAERIDTAQPRPAASLAAILIATLLVKGRLASADLLKSIANRRSRARRPVSIGMPDLAPDPDAGAGAAADRLGGTARLGSAPFGGALLSVAFTPSASRNPTAT